MTDARFEYPFGLYFIRSARTPDPLSGFHESRGASIGEQPDALDRDGWRWTDVWFDRPGAEELVRRAETSTIINYVPERDGHARDVSPETTTVAEVVSTAELLASGGHEALRRALAAVQMSLNGCFAQYDAGVRFGRDTDASS